MKFGPLPVSEAAGAIAAHSVRAGDVVIRKGHHLTQDDTRRLAAAGVASLTVAVLEPGDVGEDEAAHRLACVVAGEGVRVEHPFTGRSNLFAEWPGVFVVEAEGVDAVNAVSEEVTLATLPAFKPVVAGEMLATVKIIPYAISDSLLERAEAAARHSAPILKVLPYRLTTVGVISTRLPGLKESVIDKALRVLSGRLAPAGAVIAADERVPHEEAPLREAVAAVARRPDIDMVIIFGASAVADRRDVVPAAISAAGGVVDHLGMPVDPGNLLLIGRLAGKPVLGAPGCARSPKENGFDWVLHRLLAGLSVTSADIMRLGVGGLLMEIVSRPQPRRGGEPQPEDNGA